MTTLTPEDRAQLRDRALNEAYAEFGNTEMLSVLDALDAAEAERAEAMTALAQHSCEPQAKQAARTIRAETAVQRVREMHVPQPHSPGQCDPDGCPDLCQECGERMPCTTRRIICERTTLGAGDWEADPAQVARYYSDKRSQRVQRALDGDA